MSQWALSKASSLCLFLLGTLPLLNNIRFRILLFLNDFVEGKILNRNEASASLDVLVIDQNGDFHIALFCGLLILSLRGQPCSLSNRPLPYRTGTYNGRLLNFR